MENVQPVEAFDGGPVLACQPAAKKRILFVDDEPKVLEGLRRMLYPMWGQWEMVFVTSGRLALQLLDESEFDLLITDIRMPEMTGIELLGEVARRHSQVIRYVLSGVADQQVTLRSVPLAHQYIVKPCDAPGLRRTIERALSFGMLLNQSALKQLVGGINTLPSVPSSYTKLMAALGNSDIAVRQIGRIIASDPAMTAKILQLVNSAFFGLRRHIGNPADAVTYLGLETVKALALTVSAFSQFRAHGGFSVEELRIHSLRVGALARRVAAGMKLPKDLADDCFTGGLLHDIGKLVLSANYPKQYDEVLRLTRQPGVSQIQAERQVFGVTHAAVGGYLLWLWGLPDPVIGAVVQHHDPSDPAAPSPSPAVVTRFADALIHKVADEELDNETFRRAGLIEDLSRWRMMAGEMLTSEVANVEKVLCV